MNLKKFVLLMLVLSVICLLINSAKPNNWLLVISALSLFAGFFTPVAIGISKGEIKILVE